MKFLVAILVFALSGIAHSTEEDKDSTIKKLLVLGGSSYVLYKSTKPITKINAEIDTHEAVLTDSIRTARLNSRTLDFTSGATLEQAKKLAEPGGRVFMSFRPGSRDVYEKYLDSEIASHKKAEAELASNLKAQKETLKKMKFDRFKLTPTGSDYWAERNALEKQIAKLDGERQSAAIKRMGFEWALRDSKAGKAVPMEVTREVSGHSDDIAKVFTEMSNAGFELKEGRSISKAASALLDQAQGNVNYAYGRKSGIAKRTGAISLLALAGVFGSGYMVLTDKHLPSAIGLSDNSKTEKPILAAAPPETTDKEKKSSTEESPIVVTKPSSPLKTTQEQTAPPEATEIAP